MLFIAALLTGCGKKWKKPAPVAIDIETQGFDQEIANTGVLEFHEGFIKISNLQVVGVRKQSDDVVLEQSSTEEIDFISASGTTAFNLDIPHMCDNTSV